MALPWAAECFQPQHQRWFTRIQQQPEQVCVTSRGGAHLSFPVIIPLLFFLHRLSQPVPCSAKTTNQRATSWVPPLSLATPPPLPPRSVCFHLVLRDRRWLQITCFKGSDGSLCLKRDQYRPDGTESTRLTCPPTSFMQQCLPFLSQGSQH